MHTLAHHRYPLILCVISATLTACGSSVPGDSNCRNLVYRVSGGLSRTEYLPCASEIVGGLDELARLSDLAVRGNRQARFDGQATLGRVNALMASAGGRNLLERWDDRALTDLNMKIHNAVTHYEAFYMVRVLKDPDPFAAQTREAAESELRAATRRSNEAMRSFRQLQ
jgi:hypothetical protein